MAITLDHINIRTDTPESVKDTFERLLGLEAGYRPPFASKGIWLYGSGYPIIHVSERDYDPGEDTGGLDHIAFKSDDYDGLIERLKVDGIDYTERVVPDTGVRQVFFRVNHEIKVEVDFDPA